MSGIQILNQFEVVTKEVFSWNNCWIGVGIGVLVGLIAAIILGVKEEEWAAFGIGCTIFIPVMDMFIGGLSGASFPEPVEYETHYEVIIDETVSMHDFMDKYEIIDTRGKLYIVREN